MESLEEPVQNIQKKRSQEQKVGRIKYTLQLLKDLKRDINEVKLMQRTILAGLKGLFHFEKPMIQRIACADEIDVAILDLLHEAGLPGVLPKDVAARLRSYGLRRHQVSRRVLRMNRRLEKEIGEHVAEKRGHHWALTSFAVEVWGNDEGDSRESVWEDSL